ncbi:guanylate kinase, partial [Francisella tularensis subsp. holarctica]|nr:guanylate kinase [Francisella tularensis subsp. holarctica]
ILPPSLVELRKSLEKRNTDSNYSIDYRMELVQSEISHADEYDYLLVNDYFSQSLEQLCKYF